MVLPLQLLLGLVVWPEARHRRAFWEPVGTHKNSRRNPTNGGYGTPKTNSDPLFEGIRHFQINPTEQWLHDTSVGLYLLHIGIVGPNILEYLGALSSTGLAILFLTGGCHGL